MTKEEKVAKYTAKRNGAVAKLKLLEADMKRIQGKVQGNLELIKVCDAKIAAAADDVVKEAKKPDVAPATPAQA